jgi:CobQ-like glutamine amidotransferase family enzyme
MATESVVRIVVLAHDLLGTYGDLGNALVLERRLAWRGLRAEVTVMEGGGPAPGAADIYLLGGGEDAPQSLAYEELSATPALRQAVEGGAVVLAVCAGYQLCGQHFRTTDGRSHPGFGFLDVTTAPSTRPRAVGEVVVDPIGALDLPLLTGFENHGGRTTLGPAAQPLGHVVRGVGNDEDGATDGAVQGHIVGTYLHGPVLARNPALADRLLSWVVGPLAPLAVPEVEHLRSERLGADEPDERARAVGRRLAAAARLDRWRRRRR